MTDYKDDPDLNVFPNLKYDAIELWQVKSGTLFDNILICDDPEYAKKFAEETWGKQKDAEKAAFDEVEKKKEAEEESEKSDIDQSDDVRKMLMLRVPTSLAADTSASSDAGNVPVLGRIATDTSAWSGASCVTVPA